MGRQSDTPRGLLLRDWFRLFGSTELSGRLRKNKFVVRVYPEGGPINCWLNKQPIFGAFPTGKLPK